MRTGDDIQSTITTVSTCYLCYFVAESGGAGVSGVCACLHVRVSPKTTACQMSVGVCACVRVFVSIMLTTYSFSHAHTRTRARAARAHTHRSSVGAHDWHSYCGVRTHSDSHGAGRTHAARGMYVYTYIFTQIRYAYK